MILVLGSAAQVKGETFDFPSILVEASTGQVLLEHRADDSVPVGSFGPLMVALLTLEQADLGTLPLDVPVAVGPGAMAGGDDAAESPIALSDERAYLLDDLVKALLVAGPANVAIAVAEAIAGSVQNCVAAMNARARRLGMSATRYEGVTTGTTSARDLARLAVAAARHENVLRWTAVTDMPFDEARAVLRNRNRLLGSFPGADGLAVSDGGGKHGIVATAARGNLRLIAVVAGTPRSDERYQAAASLLERGFAGYERVDVIRRGERLMVSIRVDRAERARVTPVAGETLTLIRRRGQAGEVALRYQVASRLEAPLERWQQVGEVVVEEDGVVVGVVPAVLPADVAAAGLLATARQ